MVEARKAEIDRGVTVVGPHRDDVSLMLGDLPAKGYASHGESWSYALALRLAAYELLRADGIEPVLALDDVFAELDVGRRDRLADLVGGAQSGARHVRGRSRYPAGVAGRPVRRGRRWRQSCRMRRSQIRACRPGCPGPELARAVLDAAKKQRDQTARAPRAGGTGVGRGKRLRGYSGSGPDPRDPQLFGSVLARLVKNRGWEKPAAEATVFAAWERVRRRGCRGAQPADEAGRRRADHRGRVDGVGDAAALARGEAVEADRRRGRQQRGHEAAHSRPGDAELGQGPAPRAAAEARGTPTARR